MPVPLCATWCPVVTRFVIDAAVRDGVPEAVVRQRAGITQAADDAAAHLAELLERMPATDDPRGWLDAELHRLRTITTGATP